MESTLPRGKRRDVVATRPRSAYALKARDKDLASSFVAQKPSPSSLAAARGDPWERGGRSPTHTVLRPRSAFPGKGGGQAHQDAKDSYLFRQRVGVHASQSPFSRRAKPMRPESAPMRDRKSVQSALSSRSEASRNVEASNLTSYLATLQLRSPSSTLTSHASDRRPESAEKVQEESRGEVAQLYTWGSNYYGQCDGEAGEDAREPRPCGHVLDDAEVNISGPEHALEDLACGKYFTAAICGGGKVVCWGKAFGVQTDGMVLKVPSALVSGIPRVTRLSCGDEHAVALLETGLVVGWGSRDRGQLGPKDGSARPESFSSAAPLRCFLQIAPRIIDVCCGGHFTLVVSCYGDIYGVGANECGQLGTAPSSRRSFFSPTQLQLPDDGIVVKQLACGARHALVLTRDGTIWASGSSGCVLSERVREETRTSRFAPQRLTAGVPERASSIDANGEWSCAVLERGGIVAWGSGCAEAVPLQSMTEKGARMRQAVVSGTGHVIAVSFACNVYEWRSVAADREPLVHKYFVSHGAKVNFVAAGENHCLAARIARPGRPALRMEARPAIAEAPCARSSVIWGNGTHKSVAANSASAQNDFQVQVKSNKGNIYYRADSSVNVEVALWRNRACTLPIDGADVKVRHAGKGRFVCSYGVARAGKMWLTVRLNGESLGQSPFSLYNLPGALHVPSCAAIFDQNERTVRIDELDACGNSVAAPSGVGTWTVRAFGRDKTSVLWRGSTGTPIPCIPGLVHVDVQHNQTQVALACQNGVLENSFGGDLSARYQPAPVSQLVVSGEQLGLRWRRPLEFACELLVKYNFEGQDDCHVEIIAVSVGQQDVAVPVPQKIGTFSVLCEASVHGAETHVFMPWRTDLRAVSRATQQFALTGALDNGLLIRDGFLFTVDGGWERLFDDDKSSIVEVNKETDELLRQIASEAQALCKFVPADAALARAKIIVGVLCDWSRAEIIISSEDVRQSSILNGMRRSAQAQSVYQVVLFKYLCDLNSVLCGVSAAGECTIGSQAIDFPLARPHCRAKLSVHDDH